MSEPCQSALAGLEPLSVGSTGYSSSTGCRCPDSRAPWARLMAAGTLAREGLGLDINVSRATVSCALRVRKPVLRSLESSWGLWPAVCFSGIQPFYL